MDGAARAHVAAERFEHAGISIQIENVRRRLCERRRRSICVVVVVVVVVDVVARVAKK